MKEANRIGNISGNISGSNLHDLLWRLPCPEYVWTDSGIDWTGSGTRNYDSQH